MYEAHKDAIFENAWKYAESVKADGKKVNATLLQIQVEDYILTQLADGSWKTSGETEIMFYDVREDALAIHYDNAVLDQLLGGFITVKNDIKNTMEIKVGSSTVSIESDNTFRNGINQCFGLDNYESDKPDTSSPLTRIWNDLKKDFYKNFIEKNRWLYLLEGVGNTLALTGLSLLLGILLGLITSVIRVIHEKTDKLYYLDKLAKTYVSIIRGTPLMVQLLIIYFVLLLPIGIEKFPAAVLSAIGGDLSGDEFDQMERLSEITGVSIPKNLATLRGKEERHTGVIDKEDMLDFVLGL
jgi:His/Glu/Gln/Arg/opine family amino acid ABC transporter permease subunit